MKAVLGICSTFDKVRQIGHYRRVAKLSGWIAARRAPEIR